MFHVFALTQIMHEIDTTGQLPWDYCIWLIQRWRYPLLKAHLHCGIAKPCITVDSLAVMSPCRGAWDRRDCGGTPIESLVLFNLTGDCKYLKSV